MSYYTLITDIGRAKEANAKATGTALVLTHFAVGDGGGAAYNPAADQTALVNETHRVPINAIYVDDDNPTWLVVEAVLLATVGGWYVREAAVVDADGDLYAIVKYPETYKPILDEGVGKDLHLRVICETANTADITLKIDPAVVLATRRYVDEEMASHAAGTDHPAATTAAQGMVELATDAETKTGTDTTRAVTPHGMVHALGQGGYLKRDATDTLAVGYTTDLDDLGAASAAPAGTVTLDLAQPYLKTLAIDADVVIEPPAAGNGTCLVELTNDAAGEHLPTWPNITITAGAYDDGAGVVNQLRIEKIGAVTYGEIRVVPS